MINNSQKRRTPRIIVIAIVVVLTILLSSIFKSNVKNFFYLTSSSLQKSFWQIGGNTSDFLYSFLRVKDLKNDNEQLILDNQKLLLQVSALEDLEKENQTLREALEINLQKDFEMVFSQIISKDISEDFILIDKGSEDNILKDMPVINQEMVLFGKISEVYGSFSRVALITNENCVFDAKTIGKEIYGIVKGKGNSNLYFDLISREVELKEKDVLVTTALGGKFPQNLLIGEVEKVIKEDTKPFQSADIKPFFDLEKTDNLFIITNF